jgi:hypothetical protein
MCEKHICSMQLSQGVVEYVEERKINFCHLTINTRTKCNFLWPYVVHPREDVLVCYPKWCRCNRRIEKFRYKKYLKRGQQPGATHRRGYESRV